MRALTSGAILSFGSISRPFTAMNLCFVSSSIPSGSPSTALFQYWTSMSVGVIEIVRLANSDRSVEKDPSRVL